MNKLIEDITNKLKRIENIEAIVLGGSCATGTQRSDSDIDIAIYYKNNYPIEVDKIKELALEINDTDDPVVTKLGEWGRWVNGGAWLTVQGQRVDFLYRDIDFVSDIISKSIEGKIQSDFWQQPPYGFHSYIYCAEISVCKILFEKNQGISSLKKLLKTYPKALKLKIINGFLWDAHFTFEHAKKSASRNEVYIVSGCLTRIAHDLVQVLYALNEEYFIGEKRLYKQLSEFNVQPKDFMERLSLLLGNIGNNNEELSKTLVIVKKLVDDFVKISGDFYKSKY